MVLNSRDGEVHSAIKSESPDQIGVNLNELWSGTSKVHSFHVPLKIFIDFLFWVRKNMIK